MREFYDKVGQRYAHHAEVSPYNAYYDRPAMLELLGDVRGRRVLDACCGPGLYAEALVAAGADVVGFDASAAMVELARARLGDGAHIEQLVLGEPLPYADASFDRVVCALAIHYVEDRVAAYAELRRVLRPDGVLVLSTSHPCFEWTTYGGSYFDVELATEVMIDEPVRFYRLPLHTLVDELTGAGLRIRRLVEPKPLPAMRERYPDDFATLSERPAFICLALTPG